MTHLEAVLLAGGCGQRMRSVTPKQYLSLLGRPLALHSFDCLCAEPRVQEVVVVCASQWRHLFTAPGLRFADPGERRQDSVAHALAALSPQTTHVVIHDSARPCLQARDLKAVLEAGVEVGAAALAVRSKATIKEADANGLVRRTLDRRQLWELQTPQVVRRDWLEEALDRAEREAWEVTDDLSLIERLGHTCQLVEGDYRNLKVTTPEDLAVAELFIESTCAVP